MSYSLQPSSQIKVVDLWMNCHMFAIKYSLSLLTQCVNIIIHKLQQLAFKDECIDKKYTHVKNIVISSVLCINCCSVPSRSHILNTFPLTLLYTLNPDFQPVLPRYLVEINKIKSFTVSTFLLIPSPSDYPLCLKKCLIFFAVLYCLFLEKQKTFYLLTIVSISFKLIQESSENKTKLYGQTKLVKYQSLGPKLYL